MDDNPILGTRSYPSPRRYESEAVDMALESPSASDRAAGNVTTGGTESIVMAVKTAGRIESRGGEAVYIV